MKTKLLGSILLLSVAAGAFQSEDWNDVVRRAIEDRKNNREVLGYIKYEAMVIPSNVPKNPNAFLMNSKPVDPRKLIADVQTLGAMHGRTEGIRRATLDAFNEVEADSDKNASKQAVGDKYQKLFAQVMTEYEKMGDAGIMSEVSKFNLEQGKTENYGFQDGVKAGQALAAKSKYVESGTAVGKAEAEKVTDNKLKERAEKEAKERATREAEANLMKPETLKPVPVVEQNTDAEIKSRLFDEPDWESSPYFKPPKKVGGSEQEKVKYAELYKKAFVEMAKKAYAAVKPVAKAEAARSLTYWYKSKYAKLDHTQILNDLTLQAKLGFLSAYNATRAEKYKRNYDTAYSAYVLSREREAYPRMFTDSYNSVKDVIMTSLAQNIKPTVEGFVVDENADGVFAPGELAFLVLDINNWGPATQNGDLVAKITPSSSKVKVGTQQEQVKPVAARSKSQIQKLLPFKIADNANVGFAANASVEIQFKGETIKTIPVSVEVNYPLEVTKVTVGKSMGEVPIIGLGEKFNVTASIKSRKLTADHKSFAGKVGTDGSTTMIVVKSLDQEGEDSKSLPLQYSGRDSSAPVVFNSPTLATQVKPDKSFGNKKFRFEISEGGRVVGFKDFEVFAAEALPRLTENTYNTLAKDGTYAIADILLISDNHDFSQTVKAAAAKSGYKVAVVDTNVSSDVAPFLEKCSQKIPVIINAAAAWVQMALANQCSVLVVKPGQWPMRNDVLKATLKEKGYDHNFEMNPYVPESLKFLPDGLTYHVFDSFIGTNSEKKLGRLNFMTVGYSPDGQIQNWEQAVTEFVMVTMPIEQKVLKMLEAETLGLQQSFELLKVALYNELVKEVNDNKKWELDEYQSGGRHLQRTRLFRFMKVYKGLPTASRRHFLPMAPQLKEAAGSFFGGIFNSRRSNVMDLIQPLTEDAASAGY